MPQVSALSKEQWQEVRDAAIAGVDYDKIAEEYGIPKGTIAVRAHRESWAVPNKVDKLRAKHSKLSSVPSQTEESGNVIESNSGYKVARIVGDSLGEIGERSTLRRAKFLESILERVETGDSLPDPKNWKEYGTAVTLQRRELGLDKPTTQVQLNLWSTTGSTSSHVQEVGSAWEE